MDIDTKAILAKIRANQAMLDSCPLHRFEPTDVKLGAKFICLKCGGTMGLTDIGWYIKGYEAGNGSCDDVWPGFRTPKAERP